MQTALWLCLFYPVRVQVWGPRRLRPLPLVPGLCLYRPRAAARQPRCVCLIGAWPLAPQRHHGSARLGWVQPMPPSQQHRLMVVAYFEPETDLELGAQLAMRQRPGSPGAVLPGFGPEQTEHLQDLQSLHLQMMRPWLCSSCQPQHPLSQPRVLGLGAPARSMPHALPVWESLLMCLGVFRQRLHPCVQPSPLADRCPQWCHALSQPVRLSRLNRGRRPQQIQQVAQLRCLGHPRSVQARIDPVTHLQPVSFQPVFWRAHPHAFAPPGLHLLPGLHAIHRQSRCPLYLRWLAVLHAQPLGRLILSNDQQSRRTLHRKPEDVFVWMCRSVHRAVSAAPEYQQEWCQLLFL